MPQPERDGSASSHDDELVAGLRSFGPVGIIAIIIILFSGNININAYAFPLGAILVLIWVKLSRTPWCEIGYGRPRSWTVTAATGVVFGIAFKLFMKAFLMPLLGAPPVNQAYHYLAGNTAILPAAIWAMLNAGFSEETMFRGYMFERLGKLLGSNIWAKVFIVAFTSIWFGLEHYTVQGVGGVEQSTIMGLIYGTIVITTKKIWMVMIAHAAFDLTALAIIYWNMEAPIAHLLFK